MCLEPLSCAVPSRRLEGRSQTFGDISLGDPALQELCTPWEEEEEWDPHASLGGSLAQTALQARKKLEVSKSPLPQITWIANCGVFDFSPPSSLDAVLIYWNSMMWKDLLAPRSKLAFLFAWGGRKP